MYYFVIFVLFGLFSLFLFICLIVDVYISNIQIDYESLLRMSYFIMVFVSDGMFMVSKLFIIKIDNVNEVLLF